MRAAFCHTMIWISHKYTYYLLPLSWASLPPFLHPTSVGYHRGQNWTPCYKAASHYHLLYKGSVYMGFSGGVSCKESACQHKRYKRFQEDSVEEGTATHFSILAQRIPRTEDPGMLQSPGSHRVMKGHTWLKWLNMHAYSIYICQCYSLNSFHCLLHCVHKSVLYEPVIQSDVWKRKKIIYQCIYMESIKIFKLYCCVFLIISVGFFHFETFI